MTKRFDKISLSVNYPIICVDITIFRKTIPLKVALPVDRLELAPSRYTAAERADKIQGASEINNGKCSCVIKKAK